MRLNVDVALQYLGSWLREDGAVAIHNLMEDAATRQILARSLWQVDQAGTQLDDGRPVTEVLYPEDPQEVRLRCHHTGTLRRQPKRCCWIGWC